MSLDLSDPGSQPVFFDVTRPPVPAQAIYRHLIYNGDLVLYLGREKHRKSNLLLQMGISMALGQEFLTFEFGSPAPLNVLIVDFESSEQSLFDRYKAICTALNLKGNDKMKLRERLKILMIRRWRRIGYIWPPFPLGEEGTGEGSKIWRSGRDTWQWVFGMGTQVVIIDPMRCMHTGDENDSRVEHLMARVREFARGQTVILAHHLRKTPNTGQKRLKLTDDMHLWSDSARGSGALKAHADVIICQERTFENRGDGDPANKDETVYFGAYGKDIADVEPLPLVESEPGSFYWTVNKTRSALTGNLQRVLEILGDPDNYLNKAAAVKRLEDYGISRATAYRNLSALETRGVVGSNGTGFGVKR